MFGNLLSSLGSFANIRHSVRAAFGAYTVQQEVNIAVNDGAYTGKRSYKAHEDYTAIGLVGVAFDYPVNDPRGLNAKMVADDGYVSSEAMVERMRTAGGISRQQLLNMQVQPEAYVRFDSHIAILVALLSTYYVLEYKRQGIPESLRQYDDGHLKIDLLSAVAGDPSAQSWLIDGEVDLTFWNQVSMENPPDRPIWSADGFNTKDLKILAAHFLGRQRTTRLAFDLDIPTICSSCQFTGTNARYTDHSGVDQVTAGDVKAALNKYVLANRLQPAFEAALAMYHQVAVNPLPDQAEGYVWLMRERTLVLPKYDSMRGMFSVMTREEPYAIDAANVQTWKWWQASGLATTVVAAMYNGFSLWGRYLVEGGFYHSDANVDHVGHLSFASNPGAAFYSYAALITGHDTYVPVPSGYGLQYAAWDDEVGLKIPVTLTDIAATGYDIERIDGTDHLVVRHLPPPCSAAHVLARMPRGGAFAALSDAFEIRVRKIKDAWVLDNMDSAWAFAMVSRWAGYDVVMQYQGQTRLANWAPNASSIASRPFYVDGPDIETVRVHGITPRARTFFSLPQLGASETTWKVEVAPSSWYSVHAHKGTPAVHIDGGFEPSAALSKLVSVDEASIRLYVPIIVKATSSTIVHQTGFQIAGQATTGVPPAPPRSAALPDQEAVAPAELPPGH